MREGSEHSEQAEPGKVHRRVHASVPNRHWRVLAALGVIAYLSWPVSGQQIEVHQHKQEDRKQEDETGNTTEDDAPQLATPIFNPPSSPDHIRSFVADEHTEQDTDYAEEDLKAQQSMAFWGRSDLIHLSGGHGDIVFRNLHQTEKQEEESARSC